VLSGREHAVLLKAAYERSAQRPIQARILTVRADVDDRVRSVVVDIDDRREDHLHAERTRHALLATYGDLWGELARNGRASLGLQDAGTIGVDRDHPDLRGVADADLPLAIATCASAAVVCRPVASKSAQRR